MVVLGVYLVTVQATGRDVTGAEYDASSTKVYFGSEENVRKQARPGVYHETWEIASIVLAGSITQEALDHIEDDDVRWPPWPPGTED